MARLIYEDRLFNALIFMRFCTKSSVHTIGKKVSVTQHGTIVEKLLTLHT